MAIACLAAAPLAGANTYCVGAATGPCDATQPGTATGLQAGLNDANANPGPDTVRIGPETYGGQNFGYSSSGDNTVRITGSGQATKIAAVAFGFGLVLDGPGNIVENLTFQARGGSALTLSAGTAQDVWFDASAAASGFSGTGATLTTNDALVRRASFTVGTDGNGVHATGGAPRIEDSTVTGADSTTIGIGASAPSTPIIKRVRITGAGSAIAVAFTGAHATVTDSLILVPSSGTGLLVSDNNNGSDQTASLTAERVTVAPMAGAGSTDAVALRGSAGGADNFTATVRNSVLLGDTPVRCTGGSTNFATLAYTYHSELDPACAPGETNRVTGDPAFVDPAADDYRLRFNSDLVDTADTTGYTPGSESDVTGVARGIDGDGNGTARIDVGAYEYPRRPPTASASAAPSTVVAGAPASFDGAGGDPDPGDEPLTYSWSFDDGGSASGQNVTHAFATPGEHTATLTVTDPTGASATATASVTVTPPEEQQEERQSDDGTKQDGEDKREDGDPRDTLAPSIGGPAVAPRAFRLGTTARVAFSLSEPATVTLAFERARPGRRKGTTCVAPGRAPRRAKRCTRYVPAGSLTGIAGVLGGNSLQFAAQVGGRTLKPGRYRVRVTATDAALNSATSQPAGFKVRPKPRRRGRS